MTIRTLTTAATLATASALLLTACGGSGGGTNSASAKGTRSSSPTAASSMAPTVKRPTITFPPGAKNVFEDQHTGNPKKDAVLADNAQEIDSVYDAILVGSPSLPALGFYETGHALASAGVFVQGYLDKGITWGGTVRYFDRRASFRSDGTAAVVYCSDESRAYIKNRKTGKVNNSPTTSDSYVLYNTRLKRSTQGVWQTTEVISQRGAKECQP